MKCALTLLGMVFATYLAGTSIASATEYPLPPPNSRLIGENIAYTVPNDGHALEDIAAKFKIGMLGMLEANPGTDPYLPTPGSTLTIPTQMLLPDTPREGVVVNLAELRLYYYPKGKNTVIVYPIGIGQQGRNTPLMTTSISDKRANPTWTPTANIRKRYLEEEGITLPAVVPAGPDNPMGLHALRLAAHGGVYLLHGTNANFGIGMRVSSGCIRLRAEDIKALFDTVPVGTRVQIINDAIKTSVEPDGKRYVEVHQPLSKSDKDDPQTMPITITAKTQKFIEAGDTDAKAVADAIVRRSGMPILVNVGQDINTYEQPVQSVTDDDATMPQAAPITVINASAQ
ncbi:L,D-transpeptidase YcfS|uniref:L,D-transpeptidase YcfS n=1 Tax=Brenneria salicis ATCC 15712 = DSM 30166 TaxID=714314 RepID=A0A366I493_9GAMM|nr:L,D-transpeptidase family protein [Brenneria salicis]NMN91924.1 L,D-transpeptidase YcfS [Brenneria salicis ATCC 15712 = DSM 30166]RBP62855.1 L,D-transpeptidase YcfS [Brenneria salicis ATCC 15712 = DSM 30166]RLM30726.1 peptidoglycan-binding protein [Brenneria salicis ATCC 15712 = DSM 30166]